MAMARRDRSHDHQREQRRHGANQLRRILLMASVLVIAIGLTRLPYAEWARQWLPDTYRVELQGRLQHVSDVEVLEAVRPYTGVALWEVNEAQVREAVVGLPWLRDVKVTKRWPDVIIVKLTEYRPMAQWGDEALLDASGVVFTKPVDAEVSEMPWLYSPDSNAGRDLWRAYAWVNEQLAGLNMPVRQLWVDERGAWHLRFANELELRLGRHERDQRLARFVRLVPRALGQRLEEAAYVDLRYGNGFAVGWDSQDESGQEANAAQTRES